MMLNVRGFIVLIIVMFAWIACAAHADGQLNSASVLTALRNVGVTAGAEALFGGGVYRLDHIDVSVRDGRRIVVVVDVSRVP